MSHLASCDLTQSMLEFHKHIAPRPYACYAFPEVVCSAAAGDFRKCIRTCYCCTEFYNTPSSCALRAVHFPLFPPSPLASSAPGHPSLPSTLRVARDAQRFCRTLYPTCALHAFPKVAVAFTRSRCLGRKILVLGTVPTWCRSREILDGRNSDARVAHIVVGRGLSSRSEDGRSFRPDGPAGE